MEVICYATGKGEMPENTLEGIKHCNSINANWRIEMDIQITRDGEIILFHDDDLVRMTGIKGKVSDTSWADISEITVGRGYKIPKLKDVFDQFSSSKFLLDIHTADQRIIQKLIELIDHYAIAPNVIIASEHDEILNQLKTIQPDWVYGAGQKEAKHLIYSSIARMDRYFPLRSDILMIPKYYGALKVLTPRIINHVKRRNKKIWVWWKEGDIVSTITTKKEHEEMLSLGIDGIFCDAPQQLKEQMME